MNTPARPRIRALLVDDHAVVRTGYRVLLGDAPDIELVAEADSGELACQRFVEYAPDVVIMDLSLPGIGGLEAARRIRARDPDARILAFSMYEEAAFVQQALRAGCRGYITKSSAPEALVDAVRRIVAGELYLDDRVAAALEGGARDALDALSPREFGILRLLAAGAGNAEIADQLCLSEKTVANYATQIRKKLGAQNRAELVFLAVRQGIVDPAALQGL